MAAAADTTAIIISITSIGGLVGSKPKPNDNIAKPIPPNTPKPMPPTWAPAKIHNSTTANWIKNCAC